MVAEIRFMKDARFIQAIPYVLNSEGGYVNHPKDPGGPTNRGIAYNYNAQILRDLFGITTAEAIKTLTAEQAKEIYFRKYWLTCDLDRIQDTSYGYCLFDASVNHGPGFVTPLLDKRAFNLKGDGANLVVYQKMRTAFLKRRNHAYFTYKGFDTFGEGWTNRLIDVAAFSERIKPPPKLFEFGFGSNILLDDAPEFPKELWLELDAA